MLNDFTRARRKVATSSPGRFSLALGAGRRPGDEVEKVELFTDAIPLWLYSLFSAELQGDQEARCLPLVFQLTAVEPMPAGCHPPPGKISTVLVCFHWHRGYCWNRRDVMTAAAGIL